MVINSSFWAGKTVFVTGHTGFKGSWLSLWLQSMGANVIGYSLPPPTVPNLFTLANVVENMASLEGDVRNLAYLTHALNTYQPEIVMHLAAQPLVGYSYQNPVETYATNVMGTVNLLEAVRHSDSVRAVVNVTSDKCYENREWVWGYRENEPMGGYDPYSSSKGCAELVTAAYRNSFLETGTRRVAVATARAGNVIGGGDWADNRLIPDVLRAISRGEQPTIRNPGAIRPWQHVLEPLAGYLSLAEKLYQDGAAYAEGWNFGPDDQDARPVGWIVEQLQQLWGHESHWEHDAANAFHEAFYLKLDCSKARARLGWTPKWSLQDALKAVVEWHRAYLGAQDMKAVTQAQIAAYAASV